MSTNASEFDPLAQSRRLLEQLFAERPQLENVAHTLLQRALDEARPGLSVRVDALRIATVLTPAAQGKPAQYGVLQSLGDALLQRLRRGRLLNLSASTCALLERRGRESWVPLRAALTVDEVEVLINNAAPTLLETFQAQLLSYWSSTSLQDSLNTRWRSVANQLSACLLHGPQSPPLAPAERERVLGQFYPLKADRERFLGEGVLRVFQVYAREDGNLGEWLVVLLIESRESTVSTYYLFSPHSGVQRLAELDDLARLLPLHMSRHTMGRRVEWATREPEEDVFEAMAQMLLEKQLRDLAAVRWSDFADVSWYKRRFSQLTAPSVWFGGDGERGPVPEQVLPLWLQGASADDRRHASRLLQALEATQSAASGFLDGLEPILEYARSALQARMRLDYPQEVVIDPNHYLLTFTRTQGGTVGWTQSTTRTLTEWALDNPFATSYAQVQISNRVEPGYIPDWWLTVDYLSRLITSVDIGKHYPQHLKLKLLDDPIEAQRRQRLFVAQMRTQLPLVALEALLRGRHGLSRTGLDWIEKVVQSNVESHNIVARPLAFLAHSGGIAYPAANLVVIGPRDDAMQPHLLYRPASVESLQEWATRQDLLFAIARPGALQTEVLASLDAQGRAVLGNGGLLQPHTQRFGQGDEFAPLQVPGPALLSDKEVPGDFLAYVYTSNARALVAQAEQQSRSNEEQRWASFRNDLWQLFNAVLPLLRGRMATAGWLYQSLLSARALVTLSAEDVEGRAAAVSNTVAQLAAMLVYPAIGINERLGLTGVEPQAPVIRPPSLVRQSASMSGLRGTAVADITPMDFGWHSASKVTPSQQRALDTFKWQQGKRPWPVTVQNIETVGEHKGLVRVPVGGSRWWLHAYIGGGLYPVVDTVDGLRVADLQQPGRLGPWVRSDAAGVWRFDLKMRLAAGMPRSAGAARRAEIQRREADFRQLYEQQTQALMEADTKAQKDYEYYVRVHKTEPQRFNDQLRQSISVRYQAQLAEQNRCQLQRFDTLKLRNANKPLSGFEQELIQQLEDIVHTLQERAALVVLARKAATPPRPIIEAWDEQLSSEDAEAQQRAHDGTVDYLSKIAEFNQQLIELSTQERGFIDELMQVSGFRPEALQQPDIVQVRLLPLDWKTHQVSVLQGLLLKRAPAEAEFYDFIMLKELTDIARWAARSHRALQEPGLLGAGEHIQGLDHVISQYAQVTASLGYYQRALGELLEVRYVTQLVSLLEQLRGEAEHSLALLLRDMNRDPTPEPVPAPAPRSGKRLVRTRDKRILMGQARARTPEEPEEIIDVVDPIDNQRVASYRQSPEKDIWEEVAPPRVPQLPPVRSLRRLLADARSLLQQEPKNIRDAWRDAASSDSPIGLESALVERARQLDTLHASLAQRAPGEGQMLAELAAAAQRLREQGRLIRIKVIKRNPPQPSRIQYLKEQGEVEILKITGRVKLARPNDYLQEYVVRDLRKQPLAYAHFHYRSETAAPGEFTAGHLKLPEQRFKSFVGDEGKTEGQFLTVHRAQINAALARTLFFDVEASVQRGAGLRFW